MQLISLNVKNIKIYDEKSFDFKGLSTLIIGQCGTGKSTIVESIYFALFRQLLVPNIYFLINDKIKYIDKKEKLRFKDIATIELVFNCNNINYKIYHELTKGECILKKYEDEEWKTISNKVKECMYILNNDIIPGITSDFFLNTIYTPQMQILSMTDQTAAPRQKEFDKMLGIEKFEALRDALNVTQSELKKECRNDIDYLLENKKTYLEEIDNLNLEIDSEQIKVEENLNVLNNLNEELNQLNNIKNNYVIKRDSFNDYYKKLYDLSNNLNQETNKLNNSMLILKNLESEKTEIDSKIIQISNIDIQQIDNKINELNINKNDLNLKIQKYIDWNHQKTTLEKLENNLNQYNQNLEIINKDLTINKEKLKELENNKEKLELNIKNLEPDLKQLKDNKNSIMNKNSELIGKILSYKDLLVSEDINILIDKFNQLGVENTINIESGYCPICKQLFSDKEVLYNQLKNLFSIVIKAKMDYENNQNEITNLENKIKNIQFELHNIMNNINSINQKIWINENDIKSSNKKIQNLNLDKNNIIDYINKNFDSDIESVIIDQINSDIANIENEITTLNNKKTSLNLFNSNLQNILSKIDTQNKEINSINSLINNIRNDIINNKTSLAQYITTINDEIISQNKIDFNNEETFLQNLYDLLNLYFTKCNSFSSNEEILNNNIDNNSIILQQHEANIARLTNGVNQKNNEIKNIDIIINNEQIKIDNINMLDKCKKIFSQDGASKFIRKMYIDQINNKLPELFTLFQFPFIPTIDDTAGIEDYYKYSGGQRISIALVVKILINFILNSNNKLLILDEPTPYMDDERIESLLEIFRKLKDDIQIIIISHCEKFKQLKNEINTIET